ncbi:MAG: DUF6326 family protein [Actinomycetota bacterium]
MSDRTSAPARPALDETNIRPIPDLTEPRPALGGIDTRLKISALWVATMFIFAYVDLFSLFRSDVRADLEQGKIFVFTVSQAYLFFTTLYIIIPSVMIYLTLVMPRRANRIANIVLASLYLVTILGGAVGEWNYYVLGSAVEAILLALVVFHAWTWPTAGPSPSS